jgi:hypothetical protein
MNLEHKRFYCKILAGKNAGGKPCVYFNKGFTFQQFNKWKWYFEYRAALIKVQNPKWHVEAMHGNYDWLPPIEQRIIDLKNKIAGKRREITKWTNAIEQCDKPWLVKAGLFTDDYPLDKDEDYIRHQKALTKIEKHKIEYAQLMAELTAMNA